MVARCVAASLREFFYPAGCACCGSPLLDCGEAGLGVCSACVPRLIPEPGPRCAHCGRPLVSELGTCIECREREAPSYDAACALFRYGGAARRFLSSYKFGAGRAASSFIAGLFSGALRENAGPILEKPFIVPVPPRPGKLKKMGWDQVSAIADRLERNHGFPVSRCLVRLPSRAQKELNREERTLNMRKNIECPRPAPELAVLIDDVLTTGATLDACASALKRGGCRYVFALTLCYD